METADERRARLRELGRRGGRATADRHGREYMRQIGKRGFRAALDRIGGEALAEILGKSYQAKYGRPIDLSRYSNPAADAERAATRRAHPGAAPCAHPGCTRTGAHRHHRAGLAAGHGDDNIERLCAEHHRATHREQHLAARAAR